MKTAELKFASWLGVVPAIAGLLALLIPMGTPDPYTPPK